MANPPTSVRSIRLPDSLWAKLAEEAAESGMTVNALVRSKVAAAASTAKQRAETRRLMDLSGLSRPNPLVAKFVNNASTPFGPQRAKPGSRLKGKK